MDKDKMRAISDKLFMLLTSNLVNNNRNLDDYVNKQDGKIYLVKGRDKELYFIVNGKFIIRADDEIDYEKSDPCLFGLNIRTDKVTSLDISNIKECIDETSILEYVKELKDIIYKYIDTKKVNSFNELREEFYNKVKEAYYINQSLKYIPKEDYILYAERLSKNLENLKVAKRIIEAKDIIERLWIKALYMPEYEKPLAILIRKIMERNL